MLKATRSRPALTVENILTRQTDLKITILLCSCKKKLASYRVWCSQTGISVMNSVTWCSVFSSGVTGPADTSSGVLLLTVSWCGQCTIPVMMSMQESIQKEICCLICLHSDAKCLDILSWPKLKECCKCNVPNSIRALVSTTKLLRQAAPACSLALFGTHSQGSLNHEHDSTWE